MAKVEIAESLKEEIFNKFKGESNDIFELLYSLKDNPNKGKTLASVGNVIIKEIRYKSFRFYFITNGHLLKVMDESKLRDLLIKFVRMSNKKTQQKTIEEIRDILKKLGEAGFES